MFYIFTIIGIVTQITRHILILFDFSHFKSPGILEAFSSAIIASTVFIVALYTQKFVHVKNQISLPLKYWLMLTSVPVLSFFTCEVILRSTSLKTEEIIIAFLLIWFINIGIFALYNFISEMYEDKLKKIVAQQQALNYEKIFKTMEKSVHEIRSIKHDLNGHFTTLKFFLDGNDVNGAKKYINKLNKHSNSDLQIANSGNLIIDNILNIKISEAEKMQVDTNLFLSVPEALNISSFDLTVILGNLLDNAIEAASNLNTRKTIDIKIEYKKSVLFIYISNTYNGQIFYDNNNVIITKKDKQNHGYGLINVKNILEKYNGEIQIKHNSNQFYVQALLYSK